MKKNSIKIIMAAAALAAALALSDNAGETTAFAAAGEDTADSTAEAPAEMQENSKEADSKETGTQITAGTPEEDTGTANPSEIAATVPFAANEAMAATTAEGTPTQDVSAVPDATAKTQPTDGEVPWDQMTVTQNEYRDGDTMVYSVTFTLMP